MLADGPADLCQDFVRADDVGDFLPGTHNLITKLLFQLEPFSVEPRGVALEGDPAFNNLLPLNWIKRCYDVHWKSKAIKKLRVLPNPGKFENRPSGRSLFMLLSSIL